MIILIFCSYSELFSANVCKGELCKDCHKVVKMDCKDSNCLICHSSEVKEKGFLGDNLTNLNIHNSKYGCYFCHSDNQRLKDEICLKCHNKKTLSIDTHSSNIEYKKSEIVEINETFPLKDGKVVCTTCHKFDKNSCENRSLRPYKFLRNYVGREEFCYNCHKKEKFVKYNPHIQVKSNGEIDYSTCLICHNQVPSLDDEYKTAMKILKGDVDRVCNGCHQIKGIHPTGTDHLNKRITGIDKYIIEKNFKEKGFNLYVGDDSKIICVTCHYPHNFEEKTFKLTKKRRVRSINSSFEICLFCHMK